MLDACSGAAAELQREDFDRLIFQQLRVERPDQSNYAVSETDRRDHNMLENLVRVPNQMIEAFQKAKGRRASLTSTHVDVED